MSLIILSCTIYGSMYFYFSGENKKRERGVRNEVMQGLTEEEVLALGDENPRFRFAK